jgi:hypothetical protein
VRAAAPQAVPVVERRRRYWIIGAVLGPFAAAGLVVGLGVGLTPRDGERVLPPVVPNR